MIDGIQDGLLLGGLVGVVAGLVWFVRWVAGLYRDARRMRAIRAMTEAMMPALTQKSVKWFSIDRGKDED